MLAHLTVFATARPWVISSSDTVHEVLLADKCTNFNIKMAGKNKRQQLTYYETLGCET